MQQGENVAAAGAIGYERNCQSCHGERGEGSDKSPALWGDDTLESYKTAHDLFLYIANHMPKDNPGGLTMREYWDITTFVVATRGVEIPDGYLAEGKAAKVRLHEE
jgi:cytochrome c